MKKKILALSLSAAILSLGAIASAAPVEEQVSTTTISTTGTVTVTFTPAKGESPIYSTQDQTVPLGIGSTYYMSGANWMILYGSNVVSLSGNKATMIGYGTAQVQAFKANGAALGVYTFVVQR